MLGYGKDGVGEEPVARIQQGEGCGKEERHRPDEGEAARLCSRSAEGAGEVLRGPCRPRAERGDYGTGPQGTDPEVRGRMGEGLRRTGQRAGDAPAEGRSDRQDARRGAWRGVQDGDPPRQGRVHQARGRRLTRLRSEGDQVRDGQ